MEKLLHTPQDVAEGFGTLVGYMVYDRETLANMAEQIKTLAAAMLSDPCFRKKVMNDLKAYLSDANNLSQLTADASIDLLVTVLTGGLSKAAKAGELCALMQKLDKYLDHVPTFKKQLVNVTGTCFVAGTVIATADGPQPIESLQVGDRVLTNDSNAASTAVDPATWRKITLRMPNPEDPSDILDLVLLRSEAWMRSVGCTEGASIWFDLDEIGLHGWAEVVSIESCPVIQSGPGRVVLATVTHFNSFVMEVRLEGTSEVLEPTDRHPLFSVTRQEWISAAELKVGEELATRSGCVRVASIVPKSGTHRVYNIEVEADHCFYAGSMEVLSHNTCVGNNAVKGGAHPNTKAAAAKGSTLHADKPGHLPEQLRSQYLETEFVFKQPGIAGQDVQVIDGMHPSAYPNSTWPQGVNHADFKPDTPGGDKAFKSDQKNKWIEPTAKLRYNPVTGKLIE